MDDAYLRSVSDERRCATCAALDGSRGLAPGSTCTSENGCRCVSVRVGAVTQDVNMMRHQAAHRLVLSGLRCGAYYETQWLGLGVLVTAVEVGHPARVTQPVYLPSDGYGPYLPGYQARYWAARRSGLDTQQAHALAAEEVI